MTQFQGQPTWDTPVHLLRIAAPFTGEPHVVQENCIWFEQVRKCMHACMHVVLCSRGAQSGKFVFGQSMPAADDIYASVRLHTHPYGPLYVTYSADDSVREQR